MESISTTFLSTKYNRSNATICHILRDRGIEPVDIGDHNCLIWDSSVEDIVRETIEKETRQVNAKQYAEELKVSYEWFKEVLKHFGIKDSHKMYRNKQIEEYVIRQKKEQPKMTLSQLKILHPLVTDERCFNINWWPDTEPVCFKDL